MNTMQFKSRKYMLQANENYKNIQDPTNKKNLEYISQCKL